MRRRQGRPKGRQRTQRRKTDTQNRSWRRPSTIGKAAFLPAYPAKQRLPERSGRLSPALLPLPPRPGNGGLMLMQDKKIYDGRPAKCRKKPGFRLCQAARGNNKPLCRSCTAWQKYSGEAVVISRKRPNGNKPRPSARLPHRSGTLTRLPL